VLIILPIYLAVLLLAKSVTGLLALLAPVTAHIPAGVQFRQVVAILLLLVICFVVGLIVRTGPGLRVKDAFEQAVLQKLPDYTFLRGLTKRLTGGSEEHTLEPGAGGDRGRAGSGTDGRGTGRLLYGARPVAADADGRQHLYPAPRPGPSDRCPVHQGDRRILEVGTGAGEFVRAMKSAAVARDRLGNRSRGPSPDVRGRAAGRSGPDVAEVA
jgi:hypothetical protein